MRKYLFVFCVVVLVAIAGCKKVCYQCTQYCAYCVNTNDSSVAYKVCATNGQGNAHVNAVLTAYQDSGYVCNLLSQQTDICDTKNGIDKAITYFEQENYYCNAK